MSAVSYYTPEGLKKLRDELNHLKDVERPKASQAIAEARDKGDLSENAEYDAAKEAQGMLEMRISKLEDTLAGARLIDESQLETSTALVLSHVKIKNQANGMELTYLLVRLIEDFEKDESERLSSLITSFTQHFRCNKEQVEEEMLKCSGSLIDLYYIIEEKYKIVHMPYPLKRRGRPKKVI